MSFFNFALPGVPNQIKVRLSVRKDGYKIYCFHVGFCLFPKPAKVTHTNDLTATHYMFLTTDILHTSNCVIGAYSSNAGLKKDWLVL